jgi:hypothetical protein
MTDDPPTPAVGQVWHSTAFADGDPDGRVEVLGTIDHERHGLLVVEHLVRGGSFGAQHVVEFLQRRSYPKVDT